jgi:hypothetical protein
MATKIVTGGGSSVSGRGNVPDGPVPVDALDKAHLPAWVPNRLVFGEEEDTLFFADPKDEQTVLADGGMLFGNRLTYADPASGRATIQAGRARNAVVKAGTSGVLAYPVDGVLALDEFTIELAVVNPPSDLQGLSSTLLKVQAGTAQTLTVSTAGGILSAALAVDERAFSPVGVLNQVLTNLTLAVGDIPAAATTVVSVRWVKSTGVLTVALGDASGTGINKVATNASPSPNPAWLKRPWSSDPRIGGNGIIVAHDRLSGGTNSGVPVADTHFRRYSRVVGSQGFADWPGIVIDAGSSLGAWDQRLPGVVGHYTGWARNEAAESAFSTIRGKQLDMLTAAGCKAVRVAEFHERAVPTLNVATPPGSVTSIDFTGLDAHWDRYTSRGITNIHCHVGYTPAAFGGGANGNTPPTLAGFTTAQANALYAVYVSQVFAHLKARYPGVIKSISFWNEPSLSGFWTGTQTQLVDLWQAVAAQHATDHADLPKIGGPDEILSDSSNTGTAAQNHRLIIDRAQAQTLALPTLQGHQYTPNSLTLFLEAWDALLGYAASKGFTSPQWGPTEWGMIDNTTSGGAGGQAILAQERPQRHRGAWMAAYAHMWIAEMAIRGASFAYFFRLGQQDSYSPTAQSEEMMGLISNTGRPWPVFAAFSLMWKHSGNRVAATPSFPHLKAIATKSTGGVVTLTYSSFRLWRPKERLSAQLAWAGLPSTYTWKHWSFDSRYGGDGRPVLIAQGDQTNLPRSVDVEALGGGAIQVTP